VLGGDLTASELTVNGFPVKVDEHGAFLARLPLRKSVGQRSWDLALRQGKKQIASLSFAYGLDSDLAEKAATDTSSYPTFPRVVRVVQSNAHTRTAASGTYDLFPDVGCKLLAVGRDRGFYSVKLCDGLLEEIESEFVALETDTSLAPAVLGNGTCERQRNRTVCTFALERPVAWSSSLSADRRTMIVTLFGAVLGTNRLRYDVTDSLLHDVARRQLPGRVELQIRCTQELDRGYSVAYRGDSLQIRIAPPYSADERSLTGKLIVVDPGHGGQHTGAP
jgi:N-acetylmuramoyl-L-alanine amidase